VIVASTRRKLPATDGWTRLRSAPAYPSIISAVSRF
jgi:hypothetical protein